MASRATPQERTVQARAAALQSWANTGNPSARTVRARGAFRARFEREVDPEGVLDPPERARRGEYARKAYMARLALKSAQARRKRAQS